MSVPLITLSGGYREMGVEYGRRMTHEVCANLDAYRRRFRDDAGLSDAEVSHWGGQFQRVAASYNTDIEQMLTGIAEGVDVPVPLIFALNALYIAAYPSCENEYETHTLGDRSMPLLQRAEAAIS